MENTYKLFCSQVSGKQPKLLSEDQTKILKSYGENECKFYSFLNELKIMDPTYKLTFFLPKFYGFKQMQNTPIINQNEKVTDQRTLQWLEHLKMRYSFRNLHNKFLILENISHHFVFPNVLDIKVGTREKLKKHKITKELSKNSFVLNGCRIHIPFSFTEGNQNKFEALFFSKYFFKTIPDDKNILQHLALYFFDGKKLRCQLLKNVIYQLQELIINFTMLQNWRFYSMSLCLFYDALDDKKFKVRLLDFGRSDKTILSGPDSQSLKGLHNIHKFLLRVLKQNSSDFQEHLVQKKQKYIIQKEQILVIPQNKIKQYETGSETNSPTKAVNNDQIQ